MLIVALVVTTVSVFQLEDNFQQRQHEKRISSERIYHYLKNISNDKRILWLTALSSQHLVNDTNYKKFDLAIQNQFDLDELRIDAVWIINNKAQQIYTSAPVANKQVYQVASKVHETQSIQDLIYCEKEIKSCFHIVAMPVMNKQGETNILLSRANLSDLLFTFMMLNENTRLALVNIPSITAVNNSLDNMEVFTKTSGDKTQAIINAIPLNTTIEALKESIVTSIDDEYFSVNLFELQPEVSTGNYLLVIEDISQYLKTNQRYQNTIVIIALVAFCLISTFVFFISRRASAKLLKLADDLPLLAKKRFEEFRQRKSVQAKFLRDELDILTSSSSQLADQLEDLHVKNEQNTRELENIAMYDLLTGLPNRNMLNFQLKKSISNLARNLDSLAVLFLDLDDFKKVNDSHGHNTGDLLLEEAARRLRASMRDGDLACRFGGDEFVIVLPKINSWQDVEQVALKLINTFKKPIHINEHRFYVSTSIGAAIAKDNQISAEELIRNADMAMYEAKDEGGNCYRLYDSGMYQRVARKVLLESEVRAAIVQNQFSLSLQPQIEISTGKLSGFEALLRWNHPSRGLVSPDEFIPILENSKHMIELGYWVISHSLEILSQLEQAGYRDIGIAINLSADQFIDPNLANYLIEQTKRYKILPSSVELELTERTLVKDVENTLKTMNNLKTLGFTFSIDDFGTGYSSLSYLKKMPVDCIKIDKCFISGMLDNQADMQIVSSTIAMVHNLGMKVTAEGVESRAQLRLLNREQCDLVQGYLFSKPIDENVLFEQLNLLVDKGLWIQAAEVGYYHA